MNMIATVCSLSVLLLALMGVGRTDAVAIPPETLAVPSGCPGCAKVSLTWENSNIDVLSDANVTNGQCIGTGPPCEKQPCQIATSLVTIKNISGGTLWYSSWDDDDVRSKVKDGANAVLSIAATDLTCPDFVLFNFYDAETGGSMIAQWGWACSPCPDV